MPDNNGGNGMPGEDFIFIRTALDALKADLENLLNDETTRTRAQWHIELVDSTKTKLDNQGSEFSVDECRVMYIAVLEMRDLMNKILDDGSSTEYDREMAKSTLYSANAMLRILRNTFIDNGVEVDDLR